MLVLAGVVVGIIVGFRKNSVTIEPQPMDVRKQPKRFNHDLAEQRHGDHERRIHDCEGEIGDIWKTLRIELPEMERRINKAGEERITKVHDRVNDVLAAVSELRGKVQ